MISGVLRLVGTHGDRGQGNWYSRVLGRPPLFDSPMATVFSVGDCTLALRPGPPVGGSSSPRRGNEARGPSQGGADSAEGTSGGVVFWQVDDIDAAYRQLLEAGAQSVTEVTLLMLRSRIARLRDPFGNLFGIMSTPTEKKASVEARPSESALTVAFCRALATYEEAPEIKGPDTLAQLFVAEESQATLKDPATRRWMIEKLAGTYEYFIARTVYGDRLFLEALREGTAQIVLLGAGYDSRAYRFRESLGTTRIFEVDALPTQERKRRLLEAAGLTQPPQLSYVPVNFETDVLVERLAQAGFAKDRQSLFLWEGVTYYLPREAVEATLAFVRQNAAAGSRLCLDYMIQAPDIESRYGVKTVLESWRKTYASEHVQFGIDEGTIGAFLSQRGFRLIENLGPQELERRFLTLKNGSLAGRVLALFNIALASVVG